MLTAFKQKDSSKETFAAPDCL